MENAISEDIKNAIVTGLDLSNLEKKEQDSIVSVVFDNISRRVNMAVWEVLSDDDKEGLVEVLRLNPKEVFEYISSKVDGFPSLVENVTRQTLDSFRQKRAMGR